MQGTEADDWTRSLVTRPFPDGEMVGWPVRSGKWPPTRPLNCRRERKEEMMTSETLTHAHTLTYTLKKKGLPRAAVALIIASQAN